MRLDHLLSKESHRLVGLPGCSEGVRVSFHCIPCLDSCSRVLCVGGGCGWVDHGAIVRMMLGTLLGPEETPGVFLGRVWPDCLTHLVLVAWVLVA